MSLIAKGYVCLPAALLMSALFASGMAAAVPLAIVVYDGAGKAISDVVVYAEPDSGTAPRVLRDAEIEQKGLKFLPLVTVIQTGSKINFPNNDRVRHHIYSFSPAHKFDQKLYAGVAASPQLFDKAGTVVLGCNIHDKMLAYVHIVDTPYFAKTDVTGNAVIELPIGKYQLKAWHYQVASGQPGEHAINIKAGIPAPQSTFTLTLKEPARVSDGFEAPY